MALEHFRERYFAYFPLIRIRDSSQHSLSQSLSCLQTHSSSHLPHRFHRGSGPAPVFRRKLNSRTCSVFQLLVWNFMTGDVWENTWVIAVLAVHRPKSRATENKCKRQVKIDLGSLTNVFCSARKVDRGKLTVRSREPNEYRLWMVQGKNGQGRSKNFPAIVL